MNPFQADDLLPPRRGRSDGLTDDGCCRFRGHNLIAVPRGAITILSNTSWYKHSRVPLSTLTQTEYFLP